MVAPNGSEELTFRHAFRITFLLSSSRIDGGDVDKVLIASNILYFLNFCKLSMFHEIYFLNFKALLRIISGGLFGSINRKGLST
jgi:hypothetical protein